VGSLIFSELYPKLPVLADNSFPNQTGRRIRCTSYDQALYSLPGSKLNLKDALGWFKVFYRGLDNPLFFSYVASDSFENPITFRLNSFADDDSTRYLYSIMIRPCFLPTCYGKRSYFQARASPRSLHTFNGGAAVEKRTQIQVSRCGFPCKDHSPPMLSTHFSEGG
jgi:hypothetical protein